MNTSKQHLNRLTPAQHSEMYKVYLAFLKSQNYFPESKSMNTKLSNRGLIGSFYNEGVKQGGLTGRGLEYCRKHFPMFTTEA